jgi:hypothetical protein
MLKYIFKHTSFSLGIVCALSFAIAAVLLKDNYLAILDGLALVILGAIIGISFVVQWISDY